MKYTLSVPCIGLALISLTACSTPIKQVQPIGEKGGEPTFSSSPSSSHSEEESSMRETKNVTYRGIVQPSGISIFMQGTHRLVLSDGRFILLESDSTDLNGYVGEEVDITGAIRPTVEAGGQIMRVEEATLVPHKEEPEETMTESSSGTGTTETHISSISSSSHSSTTSSKTSMASSVRSITSSTSSDTKETSESTSSVPPEMQTKIDAMAKEEFSAENWTQEYCSGHIGFCFPVHRNWWYKSFGATTSVLWHIEVSNSPVLNLGDGPIVINLIRGPLTNPDLTVSPQGNSVIGFRQWSSDQHFEISAPASLKGAVEHITKNISVYEE